MKITIVKACCDLGLITTGSQNGPLKITRMDNKVDKVSILHTDKVKKETDPNNKVKNIKPLNKFNKKLYNKIVKDNNFVITLGGDHSIAIGSILASAKKHKNMGIIWIDAHSDYHTVDSTISGNIHGMPLCTVNGQNGYVKRIDLEEAEGDGFVDSPEEAVKYMKRKDQRKGDNYYIVIPVFKATNA